MAEYTIASGYSLDGGSIDRIPIQKFSGLKMEVETSPNVAGNMAGGKRKQEPRPSATKPGEPTFIAPISGGDMPLGALWEKINPAAQQGKHAPEDLIFSFEGENGQPFAQWQLKGVFPKSYSLTTAEVGSAELAAETITLSVTEIERTM